VNEITRDIGKLFLGANLECAQCHNHPQIEDFKQQHFFGISAFYVRSFVMTDTEKRVIFAEKADGEATFESVFEIRDKVSKGPNTWPSVTSSSRCSSGRARAANRTRPPAAAIRRTRIRLRRTMGNLGRRCSNRPHRRKSLGAGGRRQAKPTCTARP